MKRYNRKQFLFTKKKISYASFWKNLIAEASHLDYGEPLPKADDQFIAVWSDHYACISEIAEPKGCILEIGSGYGVLAVGLARISGHNVWTTEHPSRQYIFKDEYRRFLKTSGVQLVANDLKEGIPFTSAVFDQVYFCDVIEHLMFQDVITTMNEISRVLRINGDLIVSTPNINRLSSLFRIIKGYSANPPLNVARCGETYGHIREFAPNELVFLLKKHGFQVIKIEYRLNPYFTSQAFGEENIFSERQARIINRLTSIMIHFFPCLGDEIYLHAKKTIL